MSVHDSNIYRLQVRGRVQGVGFRYFTRDLAQAIGIAGWVRNLPSGDVEVLARLDTANRTRFITELERGPPAAAVTNVRVVAVQMDCPAHGFSIRG